MEPDSRSGIVCGTSETLSRVLSWTAGRIRFSIRRTDSGLELVDLAEAGSGCSFVSRPVLPLFSLTLRHAVSGANATLSADQGWTETRIEETDGEVFLEWRAPANARFKGFVVVARVALNAHNNALEWTFQVHSQNAEWGLWRVVFPQIPVRQFSEDAELYIPRGPGEVPQRVWNRAFQFRLPYPRDYCTMQYMAAYGTLPDSPKPTGLYIGVHDPYGSAKEISAESDPAAGHLVLAYDHSPPDMGVPGREFVLPGRVVWKVFSGDWFDATQVYRAWVRSEARWMPKLECGQRADTPQWFKDGCVWLRQRGDARKVVPAVKRFAEAMHPLPVAFHWYDWHQIPYDNDYPHYFPAKEGFEEGIREIQEAGIRVMPYINGRLWDMRDRGMEDWQFTTVARPACCKDENGIPYWEEYASKEEDDTPVRLANMCPVTPLWRGKISEIVQRLIQECGVDGVYIDQVAAAPARLCFDASHGHPVGGGGWWNEAYRDLIDSAARHKRADTILTTESNAEPFASSFDGYLTWHWQFENQVPAFPAVYAGAIQMFGRSFRPGPTKALSYRMKAGEQLVFGEQIGWVEDAAIVDEPETLEFLRHLAAVRWRLREFFYAGEMMRPPALQGNIPRVRGDYRWFEEWMVSLPALLAGAWALPSRNEVAFIVVNVSDETVHASLPDDLREYGIDAEDCSVEKINPELISFEVSSVGFPSSPMSFVPRAITAWIFRPAR